MKAAGDPKHAARATRSAGRKMRSLLLDAASPLFRERGLAGTSITDIAAAADAFPSQITYYFRTKEALFVEAACRDVLYLARATEQAALKARTPRDYTRALAETVTATDSVAFFAEALTLTRRRQDLAPLVERTIERLHSEGARAYAGQIARHGWRSPARARRKARGGSGRSRSASCSRAMPWAGRPRKCAPRCCACWASRRRQGRRRQLRACVSSATRDASDQIRTRRVAMTALRMRARDFLTRTTDRRARARRPGRASR